MCVNDKEVAIKVSVSRHKFDLKYDYDFYECNENSVPVEWMKVCVTEERNIVCYIDSAPATRAADEYQYKFKTVLNTNFAQ